MKRVAPLAIIALAVPLSTAEAANLTGEQIGALISGKTVYWHNITGHRSGKITWSSGGSQKISGDLGKVKTDTGKWRVSGNKLCSTWEHLTKGKEKCEAIKPAGKNSYQMGGRVYEFK